MSDNCYRFSTRDDTAFRCGCGEGFGLPEVTADDNGKVLVVYNGEWGVGEASGSGSSCNCPGLPATISNALFSESFSSSDLISMGTQYGMTYHYEIQLDGNDYILTEGNQYVITFNGTEYTLPAVTSSGSHAYLGELNSGTLAIIYDNYPFWIVERDNHTLEVWVPEEENASVEIKRILLEDNKILTVSNGSWVAGNPDGSCNLVQVDLTEYYDPDAERNFVNYSWNDFKAMIDAGKIPYVLYDTANDRQYDSYISDPNDSLPIIEFMYFGQLGRSNTGYKMYTVVFRNGAAGTLLLSAHNDDPTKPMYIFTEG